MRRSGRPWSVAALLAGLLLGLAAPAGAQEEPAAAAPGGAGTPAPPPIWHVQAMTSSESTPPTVTYFWSKGRSLRSLTVVAGRPVTTIVHKDQYYVVDELAGRGIAIQRSNRALEDDREGGRPFAREFEVMIAGGAERVRTERFGTNQVDVYRLTDGTARREVWVPREGPQLPFRVEIFDRTRAETRRTEYLGWTRDLRVPDSFFEPDANADLDRMTYEEYLERSGKDLVGPAPVLYGTLLHGLRPR